jgi:hypothetical protein
MATEKLEAARRTGSLTNVIGAMREEQGAQQGTATSGREQLDIVDGAIRVAANLSATGTKGAERRQAISAVQPGSTVTSRGVEKTRLSRKEKLDKTVAWARTLTEDEREKFIVSEKFNSLTDRQAEGISEAFDQLAERELENSLGVENIDLNAELPDVDEIVGVEDDGPIDVADLDEADFEALFEGATWESEKP